MKKAIVFGGSGFVGSHVADALTNAGIETTIFDLSESNFISSQQHFICGDVRNVEQVKNAIKGKDYVYHLAGQADIGISIEKPRDTISLNVEATLNILEACKEVKIDRFIFASTVYVYSNAGSFYKVSKQACELIIEEYQKNFNIDYTILRYGSLYGPRANEKNFIYKTIKQALLEKKISIGFGVNEKRDFINVVDAARMSVDILEDQYKNSHVMLTGYQHLSRGEVLNIIKEMLSEEVIIETIPDEIDQAHGHYKLTPYVFKPRVSKKIVSSEYLEFGQGILECMEEIYEKYISK